MESVFNMLRPLHFVLLLSAFAFLAFASAIETKEGTVTSFQTEVETPAATNDLETDASAYWGGYGRYPGYGWRYGGYPGYGWRGGYGWGGRGYGRGYGWGGYWG